MNNRKLSFEGSKEQLIDFLNDLYVFDSNVLENVADFLLYNCQDSNVLNSSLTLQLPIDSENDEIIYQAYKANTKIHFNLHKIIIDIMVVLSIGYVFNNSFSLDAVLTCLWDHRNCAIRIKDRYFCVYLKIIYYGFSNGFTTDQLFEKFNISICNNQTKLFDCSYRNLNTINSEKVFCQFKDKSTLNTLIKEMMYDGILVPEGSANERYKLNK